MALPAKAPAVVRPTSAPENAHPHAETFKAVEALYQACHLPKPVVLVVSDAVQFARCVCAFSQRSGTELFGQSIFLGTQMFFLAVALSAQNGWAAGAAFQAVFAAPFVYTMFSEISGRHFRPFWIFAHGLLVVATAAAAAGFAAGLGAEGPARASAAGSAAVCYVITLIVSFIAKPLHARRSLHAGTASNGVAPSWWSTFWGHHPVDAALRSRLQAALAEQNVRAGGLRAVGAEGMLRGQRERTVQRTIEAEMRRIDPTVRLDMLLGRSAGHDFEAAGRVSHLALHSTSRSKLPRLLQAAVAVDDLADAVCTFQGVAIVLPLRAPLTLASAPPPMRAGWRRSQRTPWAQVLQQLGPDLTLAFAIDVAPFGRVADWLIARRVRSLPDAATRTPAIRHLGIVRFARAVGAKPLQEDDVGRLYHFGPADDPSAFVAVYDKVLGQNGVPLEHWIAVPPHVATAREAVAWSFGLSEAEYAPARES